MPIWLRRFLPYFFRLTVISAAGAAVVTYLCLHTLYGRKGLVTLATRHQEEAILKTRVGELVQQRQTLQRRTRSLVEPYQEDMLVEQARIVLNYVQPDEVMIPIDTLFPAAARP